MNNEWKPVVGYEGFYEISDNGEIKSLIKNRLLKPCIHKKGYLVVTLTKGNAHKNYYVHRLVAAAFLDNDDSLKEVNHIDGNKKNNNVCNLEWCDDYSNRKHAYETGLRKMCEQTKVKMCLPSGEIIQEFESISEASKKTGINIGNISSCCNGKRNSAGGYVFIGGGTE